MGSGKGEKYIAQTFDINLKWRLYTSLNALVCTTRLKNGKFIDFYDFTDYCLSYKNKLMREKDFQRIFECLDRDMEAASVLNIFQHMIKKQDFKYSIT